MEQTNQLKTILGKYGNQFNGFAETEVVEKGIAIILSQTDGMIALDENDIEATLKDKKEADILICTCLPEELGEVLKAQWMVLTSRHPDLTAKSILVQLCVNHETDLLMSHMNQLTEFFNEFDPETDIIWGVGKDNDLTVGEVEMVLLSGF